MIALATADKLRTAAAWLVAPTTDLVTDADDDATAARVSVIRA